MAEVGFTDPLKTIEPRWREDDLACYRAIARRPPTIFGADGQPATISSEIGPWSVIRLSLVRSGDALVVRAVSIIELQTRNPFRNHHMAVG